MSDYSDEARHIKYHDFRTVKLFTNIDKIGCDQMEFVPTKDSEKN